MQRGRQEWGWIGAAVLVWLVVKGPHSLGLEKFTGADRSFTLVCTAHGGLGPTEYRVRIDEADWFPSFKDPSISMDYPVRGAMTVLKYDDTLIAAHLPASLEGKPPGFLTVVVHRRDGSATYRLLRTPGQVAGDIFFTSSAARNLPRSMPANAASSRGCDQARLTRQQQQEPGLSRADRDNMWWQPVGATLGALDWGRQASH